MTEETIERRPYFSTSLEIPYDHRFMNMALDWAVANVTLAGGQQSDSDGLRLALEENLNFIIGAYPDAEPWELIRLGLHLLHDGMAEVTLSNAGPPVHLDRIPRYDPEDAAASDMDGLWFFLAKQAVDSLEFKNLGMDGWMVVIGKQLSGDLNMVEAGPASEEALPAKLKFTVREATVEDAAELVDLTYDTYRYTYPGDELYHKDKLAASICAGTLTCLVVETDGVIAGNSSISIAPEAPKCAYLGALMVRRRFRRTRAIGHIIKYTKQYFADNPMDVDVFYGTMVTAHPASQKAGAKCGMLPLSLLLGVGAAVDYRGMNLTDSIRESFVLCVRLACPPTLEALHIPRAHHAVMRPLLDQLGCHVPLSDTVVDTPPADTLFSVEEDAQEGTAYFKIQQMGADWATTLRKKLFRLKARGIDTVIVQVPAWKPQPANLDEAMGWLNGIFTGLKPVSTGKFYTVYCLLSSAVDFDAIQLADPLARDLLQHVRTLYDRTFSE